MDIYLVFWEQFAVFLGYWLEVSFYVLLFCCCVSIEIIVYFDLFWSEEWTYYGKRESTTGLFMFGSAWTFRFEKTFTQNSSLILVETESSEHGYVVFVEEDVPNIQISESVQLFVGSSCHQMIYNTSNTHFLRFHVNNLTWTSVPFKTSKFLTLYIRFIATLIYQLLFHSLYCFNWLILLSSGSNRKVRSLHIY